VEETEDVVRGFYEDDGEKSYVTRTGERLLLSQENYVLLRVIEDFVNRNLFVNTMDLKRSVQSLRKDSLGNKKPPRRPFQQRRR